MRMEHRVNAELPGWRVAKQGRIESALGTLWLGRRLGGDPVEKADRGVGANETDGTNGGNVLSLV